jgi:membrane protease YdiL (CAAX protease family)
VGIFIRRPAAGTVERLGIVRPAWWQIVVALAAAGIFFGMVIGFDTANHYLLPDTARRVDAVNSHLFGQLATTGWWGVLVLAFLPGICEELLFRGALQPRLGLVTAAVLFTSIHSQYGLSLDLAAILLIAISLGLLRKWTNTTTSMTAHIAYNLLAGITIAGTWVYVGLGVEAVLVGAAALVIWRQVRSTRPSHPDISELGGQTGPP